MRARATMIALSLLAVASLTGCVTGAPEIELEVETVAWELRPLHLEPDVEVHFGRALLGLASTAARWSDDVDAEFAADVIDGIDQVQVGVYRLEGRRRDAPSDLGLDAREELADLGWEVLVRTRDFDGSQWVFVRPSDHGHLEMLIVGLDDDEVIVCKLEGDLAGAVDSVVRRENQIVAMARDARDS